MTMTGLDALVAERVMGIQLSAVTDSEIAVAVFLGFVSSQPNRGSMKFDWGAERDFEVTYSGSKFGYGGMSGNNGYGLWFWEQRAGTPYQPFIEAYVAQWRRTPRPYSTDITCAWDVVQHMRANRWQFYLQTIAPGLLVWNAGFIGGPEKGSQTFEALADTAELAICRAAVAVFGGAA